MRLCQLSNVEDSESSIAVLNTQSAHDRVNYAEQCRQDSL